MAYRIHKLFIFLLYTISICGAWYVFSFQEATSSILTIISTGAILATFGAALLSIAQLVAFDNLERVKVNLDIYFEDINSQKKWKRWPFLGRLGKRKLMDKSLLSTGAIVRTFFSCTLK